ncbi:MAG: hypothetical protein ACE5EG_10265, partial [Thermoanaerobaculia bacterium]
MAVQSPRAPSYEARSWRLTELLPDDAEATVAARLAQIDEQVDAFEGLRDTLGPQIDPASLGAVVD